MTAVNTILVAELTEVWTQFPMVRTCNMMPLCIQYTVIYNRSVH